MTTDIIDLRDPDFRREVLEAEEPVLVDFTAQWCGPCRAMKPALESLAAEYKGRVKVTQIDVDENLVTAQEYGIRSMPTLLFFKKGKVVGQIVGAIPKAKLASAFQQVL